MRASRLRRPSPITPEDVRRSRRAYFANLSYVDEKIGEILAVLDRGGMAEDTAVLFLSDHGDMLGERGLWFKMSFRDGLRPRPADARRPRPRRRAAATRRSRSSTCCPPSPSSPASARSSDATARASLGAAGARGPVPMEYAAEGSVAPMVALRDGRFKLTLCDADPPQLFDLEADPHEAREPRRRPRPRRHPRPPHRRRPRPLGPRPLRPRGPREPGPPPHRLRGAARTAPTPLGPPAAPARLRALHAQPHGPERPRGRRSATRARTDRRPSTSEEIPPGISPPPRVTPTHWRTIRTSSPSGSGCTTRSPQPRITSRIPPATSAIASVSRRLGRSPKAKRAVSQLKTSSTCPTAFTCATVDQGEGGEPAERGQHPRRPDQRLDPPLPQHRADPAPAAAARASRSAAPTAPASRRRG